MNKCQLIFLGFLFFLPLVSLAQDDTPQMTTEDPDALVVTTSAVTIEEIIAAIGLKMEQEMYSMDEVAYTTLVTVIARNDPGLELQNYVYEESATRVHMKDGEGGQVVNLWERTRKYEDGELVEDETDEEVEAEWIMAQESTLEGMPFAPGGSSRYNYTILDRREVGNSLIYKVRFEPRSRFEALPTGVVWVDFSNWAIRKVEAEMVEVLPYPMFLKGIPTIRLSRQRVGNHWFTTEIYFLIQLRKVPLTPIPRSVEIRVTMQDIMINGQPASPENAIADVALPGTLPTEDEVGDFWISSEASEDSLSAYWGGISQEWELTVSPELEPVEIEFAKLDSLSRVGEAEMESLQDGGRWKIGFDATAPQYNRAHGVALFAGLSARKTGPRPPRVNLAAGYGFSNRRWLGSARFDVPLIRSRWKLSNDRGEGALYRLLTLNLSGEKRTGLFAGDDRRYTRSASSFFYGSDPNHYFENRGGAARLTWRAAKGLRVFARGGYYEHRALQQRTSWNLLGRSLRPDGNYQAAALDEQQFSAGASWGVGPLSLSGDITWHTVKNSTFVTQQPGSPAEADFREINLSAEIDVLDASGNQWLLRSRLREFDRQVPLQWKTWLGDFNTLRGYQAGELTGDAGAWASLDVRLGWDLWRALKVPVLKNWGLQPIGFADWGHTWNKDGTMAAGPEEGFQDWRADVGFGFGRRFDLPGLGANNKFRMYAAHPVLNGHEGHGWRFLLAYER